MGVSLVFLVAISCSCLLVTGSEDVELKDPHLLEVATFGATSLLKDPELELENFTLQRIMDSQVVPQAPPAPIFYLLTLEMGPECEGVDCRDEGRKICEITVLDEPLAKRMSVFEGKTECRTREPDEPITFLPNNESSIARSIPLETPETKNLVEKAITQMTTTRGGKHSLKQIGQARKVMMEESNSNLYYLTLYISTLADESISEVCEVTMEEAWGVKADPSLQSLRCFSTGDGDGPARLGIVPIASDELASGLARSAILASLAVIDAESRSQFQLKVVGYSVENTRASVDSGTRDIDMKLGLVPTLCIKHPETDDDDSPVRSCPIDNERAPSICSITLTQWPWVSDGYLFSDLKCLSTNYSVISDELEPYADDDASSSAESGLEVEEVDGNGVQALNRDDEEEEDGEEEESVEEETAMKKRAPCAGCPEELDPEDDAVVALATYSLAAIEEAANSDKVQTVERVVKATSQVVAGIKYEVTVETVDTNCKRGANVERSGCQADSDGSRHTCSVTLLDQPWIGPKQILEIACAGSQDDGDSPNDGDSQDEANSQDEAGASESKERSLKAPGKPVVGGLTPLASDDEEVHNMALFALDSLDSFDDNSQKRVLVRVLEAGYQVVAGKLYKMKIELAQADCPENSDAADPSCRTNPESSSFICDVQVLAQPWTDEPKRLVDSKCSPAEKSSDTPIEKRVLAVPVVGGISSTDSADDYIQEVARYATVAINQRSNDDNNVKLLRVLNARTQTVAGKNVFLDVEVGYTDCAKGVEAKSADECNLDESRTSLVCHITVWDRPWLNERQVTELSCDEDELTTTTLVQEETTTEQPVTDTIKAVEMDGLDDQSGAPKPVEATPIARAEDVDDPLAQEIQGYSDFALAVIEEQSSPEEKLAIVKILASSIQSTDDGKNIYLTLEIGQTGCRPEEISAGRCRAADPPRSSQVCNIQMRRMRQETEVINLQCQPKLKKSRAAVPSEDIDESPFVGYVPGSFRLGSDFNIRIEGRNNPRAEGPTTVTCSGCYRSASVDDVDVQEMASFATAFISQSSNSGPLQLVKVTSAEKQVVAGMNYKLTIQLAGDDSSLSCQVVVFNQPWTNTRQVSSSACQELARNEKVAVDPPAESETDAPEIQDPQNPPPGDENEPCAGCYSSINVDDADVQEMASFAAASISQSSNSGPLRLVKVTAAEKQVVAGLNYRLTIQLAGDGTTLSCSVVVFDQPWTGTREVKTSACQQARKRRSTNVVGGATPMDLSDPKIKELSQFALTTIGQRTNDPNPPILLRVIKASKQVVSGILYVLEMEIAPSNCIDGESCRDNSGRQRCTVTIWDQPWTGKREMTKMSCKEAGKSILTTAAKVSRQPGRRLLGGVIPADPHSDEIKSAAAFALQTIQAQSNSNNRLNVVTIRNAATQTVSGLNIFLTLEIGETRCAANQTEAVDCPFDDQADRQMCKVKIWSRPWLGDRQVLESKCKPISVTACKWKNCGKRIKRQQLLGKEAKEPKRLRYMSAFRSFVTKFDRVYKTWAEFEFRYKVYRANQKRIELLTLNERGTAVYGDTEFSDLTEKEFKERHTGLKPLLRRPGTTLDRAVIPNVQLPNEYDWRNFNVVTPVKNQGQCGSCWAFSVTGNIEGLYGIQRGQLISLSEQELVDCDKLDSGCNGGLPENAYKAIQDLGGLETEDDYPYNGHQNKCHMDRNITQVKVTGGVEISKNETEMAQWLIQNGPISIGINANGMQFYRGGVSHPWKVLCRPGGIDHGVVIVGYGVSDYPKFNKTLPYWIVKNSWGTKWGEQGYYRVYRGDGTCGLNEMATSAVIE